MERYLIKRYANTKDCLLAAIEWLSDRGGCTVVTDERKNIRGCLGLNDSQLDKYFKSMSSDGVEFTWSRKGLPYYGNVIAAFTTKRIINELDERNLDSLLVIGWSENDFSEWEAKYSPEILTVHEPETKQ